MLSKVLTKFLFYGIMYIESEVVDMELKDLLKRYEEYSNVEFGKSNLELDTKVLGLAYTTLEGDEEVQVSYDIERQEFIVEISFDDKSYIYKEHLSWEDFYEELKYANFEMYYSYAHRVCEERFSLDLEW